MARDDLLLNRYRSLEIRGKGGMGTVEIAWDNRIQRRVAIKHIPLGREGERTPGLAEARAAAMLSSPHIVQVLDFEVTNDEALLIMECIDGPTLAELMAEGPLSIDEITAVFYAMCEALSCAHENQMLHLDIKPANILIDHNGNVKVSDFGISSLSGSAGYGSATGGTIGYMPPEQLQQQAVDTRTDEWALAMVLYQMMVGRNPVISKSIKGSLELMENSEFPVPSGVREELDEGIDDVIFDALSLDPYDRFPSVGAFKKAVAPYLGDAARGRQSLKGFVDEHEDDEVEQDHVSSPRRGSSGMGVGPRGFGIIDRVLAFVLIGWVGLLGMNLFATTGILSHFICIVIALAIAVLSALLPRFGSLAAIASVCVGLCCAGVLYIGIACGVIGVVWWLLCGRKFNEDSVLTLSVPLFTSLCLGFLPPLLTGYLLPWRRALATAFFGALLTLIISSLTNPDCIFAIAFTVATDGETIMTALLAMLIKTETWLWLAAYVLSALVVSIVSSLGGRFFSLVAVLLGIVVILVVFLGGTFLTGGAIALPETFRLFPLIFSGVLACIIALLDLPDSIALD